MSDIRLTLALDIRCHNSSCDDNVMTPTVCVVGLESYIRRFFLSLSLDIRW